PLGPRQSTSVHACAHLSKAHASQATSYSDSRLGRLGLPGLGEPVLAPLQGGLLRQDSRRSVVHVALTDPPCAELRQDLVETLAAEIKGFRVRTVAEPEHAVVNA